MYIRIRHGGIILKNDSLFERIEPPGKYYVSDDHLWPLNLPLRGSYTIEHDQRLARSGQ